MQLSATIKLHFHFMKESTPISFRIAVIVALGGFIFGFDASVISGVVGYVTPEFGLNVWQQGFVVSAPTLAAIFASLSVVPLSDFVGRKRMLQVVSFLYFVSAIVSAFAPGFWVLVAARAVGGLAFGSLMITPVYIAEIAPPKQRGLMVSVNQMNIVIGLSAAYFSNYLLVQLSQSTAQWVSSTGIDTHIWRWMLGMETLPALAWVILLFLVPESPRWLIVKGKEKEAKQVFTQLLPIDQINTCIAEIKKQCSESTRSPFSLLKELFHPCMKHVLLIGALVGIIQQITGINAVFFFATSIFEQSGAGTDAAFAQAVFVGVINVVFTIFAMLLIDKLGRKPLMIIGLSVIAASMALTSWGFSSARYEITDSNLESLEITTEKELLTPLIGQVFESDVEFKKEITERIGADAMRTDGAAILQVTMDINPIVVLTGILGFVAAFAISLGPVMWVILSEIFPNHLRGIAIASIGFINAMTSFAVQFLFPWEIEKLGTGPTFAIYGVFAIIGLILVLRYLPETKGKTLEQIKKELVPGH